MNRVCMARTKYERFRECRSCKVVAMFELLEDLLSISAIFVPSCIQNKTFSLRSHIGLTILTATN